MEIGKEKVSDESFSVHHVKQKREKPYEKSWENQPRNKGKTERQTQVFEKILRQQSKNKKNYKLMYYN